MTTSRAGTARPYPEIRAGGLRVACIGRAELARLMVEECLEARVSHAPPKLVFGVNGQSLSRSARDPELRRWHDLADHVHADSQPLVLVARLLARPRIPERSPVTDFFHDSAEVASAAGLRIYLLGATEENNVACTEIMRARYPNLQIVGRRNGFFAPDEEESICAHISDTQADVVWVGLGTPLEQGFCVRNRHRIRAGWLVGAGGCFNFVSGQYGRAPLWMQRAGLEWAYRVAREPRRLARRYAITNPHALYLLLTQTSSLKPGHAGIAVGDARTAGSPG